MKKITDVDNDGEDAVLAAAQEAADMSISAATMESGSKVVVLRLGDRYCLFDAVEEVNETIASLTTMRDAIWPRPS